MPTGPAGVDYVDTGPDRRPGLKKHGASIGELPNPFHRTRHVYESEPERAVLTVLMAQPWVLGIREQVTVKYEWQGGETSYTIDVVVRTDDGRRIAYAVRKTEADLRKDDTLAILNAICAQRGARVAHVYRTLTYETLDPVAVVNARMIVRCGRDLDGPGRDRVRETLGRMGATVTLGEVARESGLGDRGVRAAIALLQSGSLMSPRGEYLALDLPLENRVSRAAGTANHPF